MGSDLRQELWHCLRLWVFEYRYFNLRNSPFPKVAEYGPTPATFHALSHWKYWMQSKPGFEGVKLTARYKDKYKNDRKSRKHDYEPMIIRPDAVEDEYRDYQLSKAGDSRPLSVGDVEYSDKFEHIKKGLCKRLVPAPGQLKFGVYRLGVCRNLNDDLERKCASLKQAIVESIAAKSAYAAGRGCDREDWLFVLYPYYNRLSAHLGRIISAFPNLWLDGLNR
jgi:hypothetical protein